MIVPTGGIYGCRMTNIICINCSNETRLSFCSKNHSKSRSRLDVSKLAMSCTKPSKQSFGYSLYNLTTTTHSYYTSAMAYTTINPPSPIST